MSRIENLHTVTKRLIIMTGVAVVVFAVLFALAYWLNQRLMLTWTAFLCGIVGGFVSIQQRLRRVSDEELALLAASWFQILLVPIFGGVFALVLYALFLSGILSGAVFPKFVMPAPPSTGPDHGFMLSLFTRTYPATGADFAKFLFWSFVAGFSERFVPQIISKISTNATGKGSGTDTKDDST